MRLFVAETDAVKHLFTTVYLQKLCRILLLPFGGKEIALSKFMKQEILIKNKLT